jgi:O-antigen/teichoic acid export membrane protein
MAISKRHVMLGATANLYSQLVQVAVQFATLGLILPDAGASMFGQWLIVSSSIGYGMMADIGVTAYGTARMSQQLAGGDVNEAKRTFIKVKSFVVPMVGAATFVFAAGLSIPWIQAALAVDKLIQGNDALPFVLALHASIYIAMSVVDSAFKADRQYAISETLIDTTRLLEWAMFIATYHWTRNFTNAAMGLLAVRVGAMALQRRLAIARLTCYSSRWTMPFEAGDGIISQSGGNLAIAVYQALWTSLPLVFLARSVGTQSVAVFSTFRTFSRVPLQVLNLFYAALAPEMSRAFRVEGKSYVIQLLKRSTIAALTLGVAMSMATAAIARFAIPLWTNKTVNFEMTTFAAVAIAMAVSAAAHPLYYFFVAIGRAKTYGAWCALNTLFMVFTLYLLGTRGVIGVAVALAMCEALNLVAGFFLVAMMRNEH